jgi:hypothetical protein
MEGRGGVMPVTGESGIGKTHLLDEIARLATEAGAAVMRGGASDADGMPRTCRFWKRSVPTSVKPAQSRLC